MADETNSKQEKHDGAQKHSASAKDEKHRQKPEQAQAKPRPIPAEDKNFRYLVRIANTDLDGKKSILYALQKIRGVSIMYANMVCYLAGVDKRKRTGELIDAEVNRISEVLSNPSDFDVPRWMLNRRKDFETGEDIHIITSDLTFTTDMDLKHMKKIRCYRGIRHMHNLPVRGQRTKNNFRRNRGKGGIGVQKSKQAKAQAASAKGKK